MILQSMGLNLSAPSQACDLQDTAAGHVSESTAAGTFAFHRALKSCQQSVLKDTEALTYTPCSPRDDRHAGTSTDHTHKLWVDTREQS